jgi:hypothetical protein
MTSARLSLKEKKTHILSNRQCWLTSGAISLVEWKTIMSRNTELVAGLAQPGPG